MIPCGPMNGIPVSLRRKSLFRFDEDELLEHKAELMAECEALAMTERRASGLGDLDAGGEGGPPPEREEAADNEVPDGERTDGDLPEGPIIPLGTAHEAREDEVWIALEARAGFKLHGAVVVSAAGTEFVRLGDRGVVRRRGLCVAVGLLGTEEVVEELPADTRVLELPRAADDGRVDFRQAVFATAVADGSDWEVKGPRTASWVLQRIAEQGPGPVHRHYWWRSVLKVTPMDSGVDDHLFLNELIETAMCADRLNVANIQAFEIVFRRLQLREEVYGQQLRLAEKGDAVDPWLDERSLFLGQRKSRVHALVAPQLEAWVAEKLAKESAVMKDRRKGREERLLALAMQPTGGSGSSAVVGGGREGPANKTKGGGRGQGLAAGNGGGGSQPRPRTIAPCACRGALRPRWAFRSRSFGATILSMEVPRAARDLLPIPLGRGFEALLLGQSGIGGSQSQRRRRRRRRQQEAWLEEGIAALKCMGGGGRLVRIWAFGPAR